MEIKHSSFALAREVPIDKIQSKLKQIFFWSIFESPVTKGSKEQRKKLTSHDKEQQKLSHANGPQTVNHDFITLRA